MSKTITLRQLEKLLKNYGFEKRVTGHGSHLLYRHAVAGALVTLPANNQALREIQTRNVFRQIINAGLASEDELQGKISKL